MYRVKPTDNPTVWNHNNKKIQLDNSAGKAPQEFNFDEILTGSENKPVYNAVARSHVCAAMDGYNAVIFAYGQTASGKTFTLVCSGRPCAYGYTISKRKVLFGRKKNMHLPTPTFVRFVHL